LTAVPDGTDKPFEKYHYDPAGNILEKTLDGKTTRYVYDKANQLVPSMVDGAGPCRIVLIITSVEDSLETTKRDTAAPRRHETENLLIRTGRNLI